MNPWIIRIIVLVIAIPLIPILVNATAAFVTNIINTIGQGLSSLLRPISMGGSASLQEIIKMALYMVVALLVARFLFGRRGE